VIRLLYFNCVHVFVVEFFYVLVFFLFFFVKLFFSRCQYGGLFFCWFG